MINCVQMWKLIKEAIIISFIQHFEAESQPQNPEFRINPENFHPCGNDANVETLFAQNTMQLICLGICRSYGPWRDKTCLRGFQQTQTSLLSYKD